MKNETDKRENARNLPVVRFTQNLLRVGSEVVRKSVEFCRRYDKNILYVCRFTV